MKIFLVRSTVLSVIFILNILPLQCCASSEYNHTIQKNFSIGEINKEALIDCLENRYEKALDLFNQVVGYTWKTDIKEFSVALWGKLICDACLENWEAMLLDMEILDALVSTCCTDCYNEEVHLLSVKYPVFFNKPSGLHYSYYTAANSNNNTGFANPDEELSPYECCERMRLFQKEIEKMLRDKFNQKKSTPENNYALHKMSEFVIKIARRGENCCYNGTHWTICCSPINQIWRTWKKNGVPDEVPDQ